MKTRKALLVGFVWAISLLGVGLWAQSGGGANARQPQSPIVRPAPVVRPGQAVGPIITGNNLGFQPIATLPDPSGRIAGEFMVKINGQWHKTTTVPEVFHINSAGR
jgi:hypothetical protein